MSADSLFIACQTRCRLPYVAGKFDLALRFIARFALTHVMILPALPSAASQPLQLSYALDQEGSLEKRPEVPKLLFRDDYAEMPMADRLKPETRSGVMSRIRGINTTPERYMFVAVEAAGLKFKRHVRDLPGSPDLVLTKEKVVVFIDGDFWHGYRFPAWGHRLPKFWQLKIEGNRRRDQRSHRRLRRLGWKVCRIWEHQVEGSVMECVRRIADVAGCKPVDERRVARALAALPVLKRRRRLPRP